MNTGMLLIVIGCVLVISALISIIGACCWKSDRIFDVWMWIMIGELLIFMICAVIFYVLVFIKLI